MRPALPPEVIVLEGTDLEGAWDRFEVFEALHHGMQICNPMTSRDLDTVLDRLDITAGDRMIDIACGHGELLIRAAERSPITGVGLDLSPWALARAAAEAARRAPGADLAWWLGDGKALSRDSWDVIACLGASWIWNGFGGTARALAVRSRPGTAVAIGDLVLKPGVDPAEIRREHGTVLSLSDQADILTGRGFEHLEPFVASEDGLAGYDRRTAASAEEWARRNPGKRAEQYLEEQRSWAEDHRRDREFMSWVVWTARYSG